MIESVRVVSTAGRSERAMSGAELTPLCVMSRGLGHVGRARAGGGAGPRLGPVVVRAAPLVAAARPAACVATRAPSQVYQVRTRAQEQTRRTFTENQCELVLRVLMYRRGAIIIRWVLRTD